MKPSFVHLSNNYPRTAIREELYKEIGWSDVTNHPAFQDTCAIRMSIGLLASGVQLIGNMKVHAGALKNKRIETGQARLSQTLKRLWGNPEIYRSEEAARAGIEKRSGVISFFRIRIAGIPTSGGHIDLVFPGTNGFAACARSCYFTAAEVWFWPLK